uniref:Phosphatidate cytidylyltransferase n=1 Tax=Ignisphaera aggregans TaxID=334771 RepID=A0A7J3JPQ9_9CREN
MHIYIHKSFGREILRKMIHLMFALALAIPLTPFYRQIFLDIGFPYDATVFTYALLTFISAFINSLQIRVPSIYAASLKMLRDFRKKVIEYISENIKVENISDILRDIDGAFDKHEEKFTEFITSVEREYERKYGYIGMTFGIVSITLAYTLFGSLPTLYGILALVVVDPITAIVTLLTVERFKKISKHTIPSIIAAFTAYTITCFLIDNNITTAISISLIAVLIELFSPEDNLTLPLIVAVFSHIFHL